MFRPDLVRAVPRSDGSKGGRPTFDHVFMFKVLILQASHSLSDERTEFLIKDRLSFMHFLGLGLSDTVPDAIRQFTPGDDIAATLARHGIRAESHMFQRARGSVSEELQVQMLDFGADMAIMGCYGHSRLREMILGGVSRDILNGIPFPVLLSN